MDQKGASGRSGVGPRAPTSADPPGFGRVAETNHAPRAGPSRPFASGLAAAASRIARSSASRLRGWRSARASSTRLVSSEKVANEDGRHCLSPLLLPRQPNSSDASPHVKSGTSGFRDNCNYRASSVLRT